MRKTLQCYCKTIAIFTVIFSLLAVKALSQTISTIAGIGNGDGLKASSVGIGGVNAITTDKAGNLYFSTNTEIRKVTKNGVLSTIAGNPSYGFSGDGGLAINATFYNIVGFCFDKIGNIYVADCNNNRIRKIDTSGIVTTIAGSGYLGYEGGDGGPAIWAQLNNPTSVAVDSIGNIYFVDQSNSVIRKIDTTKTISLFAGGGGVGNGYGNYPNGTLATNLNLGNRIGLLSNLAIDNKGNVYFPFNGAVSEVSPNGVLIATIAGTAGEVGNPENGQLATNAFFEMNLLVSFDQKNNLVISSPNSNTICKVDSNGIINIVAGNGISGYSKDGSIATQSPIYIANGYYWLGYTSVDTSGNLFYVEADSLTRGFRVRKVNPSGVLSTVAGNGSILLNGDSIPATSALLSPYALTEDRKGDIYIADPYNSLIRKQSSNGILTNIVGNTNGNFLISDGKPATFASLNTPLGLAIDSLGNLFISDQGNSRVRKVDSKGIITTVAGIDSNFNGGFSGDKGLASKAELNSPSGIALDRSGNLYIADSYNNRIRKVDSKGIITTIAGNGYGSTVGDGGLAINAGIQNPSYIALDSKGNVYFTDGNNNVRVITTDGKINRLAGNGNAGYGGDGGKAVLASLNMPNGIAVSNSGDIYIADSYNNVIRKIGKDSIITTVAGNDTAGFAGDGSLATKAKLNFPYGLTIDSAGNLLIADAYNNRVRKVTPSTLPVLLNGFVAKANSSNSIITLWSSATEINSSYFEVQHSANGVNFEYVGTVYAKGEGGSSYQLVDNNPTEGINYYRIKMVDKNGSYTYTNVVNVSLNQANYSLLLYPVPVKDNLIALIRNGKAELASVQIVDIYGKVILQKQIQLGTGINKIMLNTASLAKGSYILVVRGENVRQQQFVK